MAVYAKINPKNGTFKFPNTIINLNRNQDEEKESIEINIAEVIKDLQIEEDYSWDVKSKQTDAPPQLNDRDSKL